MFSARMTSICLGAMFAAMAISARANSDPAGMGRIKPIMLQCSQENFKQ